jgi:hypothetical protein
MFTTRRRSPGNGLVGWSFVSTSMVVVAPRLVTERSAPGCTTGRVEATTPTVTVPARPALASSATPIPTDAVVFFFAVSATEIVSCCFAIDAVVPAAGRPTIEYRSSGRSFGYG